MKQIFGASGEKGRARSGHQRWVRAVQVIATHCIAQRNVSRLRIEHVERSDTTRRGKPPDGAILRDLSADVPRTEFYLIGYQRIDFCKNPRVGKRVGQGSRISE